MKKFYNLSLSLLLCSMFMAQSLKADVVLNSANFPDSAFRAFVASQTGISEGGTITDAIITGQTSWICTDMGICSLKGIEYFTNLQFLAALNNHICAVDLSHNPLLGSFMIPSSISADSRPIKVNKAISTDGTTPVYYIAMSDIGNVTSSVSKHTLAEDGFDVTKVQSWTNATVSSAYASWLGGDALILDPNNPTITYTYNTGYTGAYEAIDASSNPLSFNNLSFSLTWTTSDILSGVKDMTVDDVEVYTTQGLINIIGDSNKIATVYTVNGQQIYSGADKSISVPAGAYIVKVGSKVKKVIVR
jgi:hypothetical protein